MAEKVVESLIDTSVGVDLVFKVSRIDFGEFLKGRRFIDSTVLDRVLEINVRRMHYIALI